MEEQPSISETTLGLTSLLRRSVAEVMEADPGQLRALDERVEGAVTRLVEGTHPLYLLELTREVGRRRRVCTLPRRLRL
jgi:hypothetical protein